jgi:hypothetical protein
MILNYNSAISSNFKLTFPTIPELEFYVTNTNIPTITLSPIEMNYQDVRAKVPDNFYQWDDVTINFLLDEDLYAYELILDWNKKVKYSDLWQKGLKDINIIPQDSNKNPEFSFYFEGAWPTIISGWQYTSGASNSDYITFDVTFAYQDFRIERIKPLDFSIVQ